MTEDKTPRSACLRCARPTTHCVCDSVETVPNRTHVTIIQHPRERAHHLGTVRLLKLALERCEVAVHHLREGRAIAPKYLSPRAGLLYPAPDAVPIDRVPVGQVPEQLIVLDGTWAQARTLYDANPWLHSLPHFTLPPGPEGNYRIRKEPDPSYLSTIEAVHRALSILEPNTPKLDSLVTSFTKMIDRQISYVGHPRRSSKSERPPPPPPLKGRLERLLLVHLEHSGHPGAELLHLGAERLLDGATLSLFLKPTRPMNLERIRYIGIDFREFESGLEVDEARRAFTEFVGEDSVVTCWRSHASQMLEGVWARPRTVLGLKTVYANHRCGAGSLQAVLEREGLDFVPADVPGRVGEMLGRLRSLAEFLTVAPRKRRASV